MGTIVALMMYFAMIAKQVVLALGLLWRQLNVHQIMVNPYQVAPTTCPLANFAKLTLLCPMVLPTLTSTTADLTMSSVSNVIRCLPFQRATWIFKEFRFPQATILVLAKTVRPRQICCNFAGRTVPSLLDLDCGMFVHSEMDSLVAW